MPLNIVVPELGESVVEATVGRWFKKEGERVQVGEPVVELETEKVNLEVGAEQAGVLARIERQAGEDVRIGDTLGVIEPGADGEAQPDGRQPQAASKGAGKTAAKTAPAKKAEPAAEAQAEPAPPAREPEPAPPERAQPDSSRPEAAAAADRATPVARRFAQEQGVDLAQVRGSGPGGRVTREDIEAYLTRQTPAGRERPEADRGRPAGQAPAGPQEGRREERVRMSRRRRTIARRLVEAQHAAAMLTTFNEVDMSRVMEVRQRRKESFKERHGVGLGFMSFFVKASIGALKAFPRLNAEIQEDEVILKHYYDIGMAVGAEDGLVVPVLRDADRMSFAEIEQKIKDYVQKAQDGTLALDDLRGGTFTLTNGGVFGSLLSTPILNPPQVGILGLHKIEPRPVAVDGQVVVRPMMYVALSYDHRIVDGREAVQFLVRVKELIEDPETLLLEG